MLVEELSGSLPPDRRPARCRSAGRRDGSKQFPAETSHSGSVTGEPSEMEQRGQGSFALD